MNILKEFCYTSNYTYNDIFIVIQETGKLFSFRTVSPVFLSLNAKLET